MAKQKTKPTEAVETKPSTLVSSEDIVKLAEEKGWKYYHHASPSRRKWKNLLKNEEVSSLDELKIKLISS